MLPYAGYVDPESTLAIGVHHDGHLEATERTFCSLYHTFMFGFHPLPSGSPVLMEKKRVDNLFIYSAARSLCVAHRALGHGGRLLPCNMVR